MNFPYWECNTEAHEGFVDVILMKHSRWGCICSKRKIKVIPIKNEKKIVVKEGRGGE